MRTGIARKRVLDCRLLFLLLTGALPVTAAAEPAPTATNTAEHLKSLTLEELLTVEVATVTTASRREESIREAPGTIIVIDRRQIERRGYFTLVDVLRDLPGVDLTPHYFSEIGTQVAIRGIRGNNKIVVLVNGMRINPPGGEYYPLRTDLSVREAEQIEVIYGPGSTLYGRDAIAAVINIITKQPDAVGGEVSMAAGGDRTRQAWGTFSGAFGPEKRQRVMGHVYYFTSELTDLDRRYPDWWAPYRAVAAPRGSGTSPDRTDEGLNAVVRLESGDTSLQFFQRMSRRSSSEAFSTILGYVPEARWEDMSTVIEGRNKTALTDRLSLESVLVYNRYEIDPDSRYVFPAGENAWFLDDFKYGLGTAAGFAETLHIDATPTLKILAGAGAATFQVTPKSTVPGGADTGRDIPSQAGQFVYFTDPGNPATRNAIPRAVSASYETYAAFTEAAWQFLPDWKAIAGIRVTEDTRISGDPNAPRFSLIRNFGEHVTLKYTYTRAFVSPATYFSDAPFDNGTVLNTSNPNLESEEADLHEINATYADARMNLGASVYCGHQENLFLIADSARPQTILINKVYLEDGTTRVLGNTVNSGTAENVGLDLFGEFQLGTFSPWASYSFVTYDDDTPGAPSGLPGLSRHIGHLGTTWAATERLLVTPSLALRSRPENVHAGALEDELELPWQLDLHLLYRLHAQADLFVKLYNVTDHRYALAGISGNAVPQETFHGLGGVRVTF